MPYEKVGKNGSVCIADEVPFEIPETWCWCRFDAATLYTTDYVANGSFASLRDNVRTYKTSNYALMVKTQDFANNFTTNLTYTDKSGYDYLSKSELHGGELMLSNIGASIGKAFIVPKLDIPMTLAPNSIIVKCIDETMTLFIRLVMLSSYGQQVLKDFTAGTAMPKFSKTQLRGTLLPVPPHEEQKRIVQMMESLLPYIERFNKAEEECKYLDEQLPDKLRKSILQQAVMGKLVPQDPNDEPASVLLENIRAEKEALIKAGKLKKDKHESIIYRRDNSHYEKDGGKEDCINDEIPFDIPESWTWCRLAELASFIGGYAYKSTEFVRNSDYQVLRLGNVKNDCLKLEQEPVYISEQQALLTKNFLCQRDDILLTMTGTRGKRDYFFTTKITSEKNLYINQRVGCLRAYNSYLSAWLIYVLKSECVLSQVFAHETGTANQGNLGAENIMSTLIPLPPFNEQLRIIKSLEQCLIHITSL